MNFRLMSNTRLAFHKDYELRDWTKIMEHRHMTDLSCLILLMEEIRPYGI